MIVHRKLLAVGGLALAMGLPSDIAIMDLIAEFGKRSTLRIPPRIVDSGACKENILTGEAVDLLRFPETDAAALVAYFDRDWELANQLFIQWHPIRQVADDDGVAVWVGNDVRGL